MKTVASLHSARILGLGYLLPARDATMIDLPHGFGLKAWPGHLCTGAPGAGTLDPKILRRAGRIHKLALTSVHKAFQEFPLCPGGAEDVAVSVGTGHAAHQESMLFIENMIRLDEREPKPTRFINSVHNSIGAQIAISFGLQGENHTFVHGLTAFESALWQALQILRAERAPVVLVCGADELTPYLLGIGLTCGWWERNDESIFVGDAGHANRGVALPGEGAAAFLIGKNNESSHSGKEFPMIGALRMKPANNASTIWMDVSSHAAFALDAIKEAELNPEDIHLVLLGHSGNAQADIFFEKLMNHLSQTLINASFGAYKRFYGDYFTATALGLALAVDSVREGRMIPEIQCIGAKNSSLVSNALIYNVTREGAYTACVVKR